MNIFEIKQTMLGQRYSGVNHTRSITADEVTRAILPYVKEQYGN